MNTETGQRYKFMLRPISSFNLPADIAILYHTKQEELDTPHGSVVLSRKLTDQEMFRFDVYPVEYTVADIRAVAARR